MSAPTLATCTACPRLAAFVAEARAKHPDWHAAPVPPWGPADAAVVCVGLAPGYRGANRTGRPFSGDQSGSWVYGALHAMGWARSADPLEAGGELCGARITNAVKCVPPQNKPTPEEQRTCRDLWLRAELGDGPARVFVAFGAIAHDALLALAGAPRSAHPFAHGAEHRIVLGGRPRVLLDSFHPSPLNTQTGKLSRAQFHAVFTRAKALVDASAAEGA